MGVAKVGGPYSLIDHNGNKVSQDTYAGTHTLVRQCEGGPVNARFILDLRGVLIFVLRNWIRWRGLLILSMIKGDIVLFNLCLLRVIQGEMTLLL
jgi:hypothetical protein